ncbi:MAG: hypothetical protein FJZ10_06155 [Candidatus Omnitrophica bacterium]|nr:hypothetical protein [Candidatus Omnitrophota bacterium]
MLSEKNKKFLVGLKVLKNIFLIVGIISMVASVAVPYLLVYQYKNFIGKAYVKAVSRTNSIETQTELEANLKTAVLNYLRGFYKYLFQSNEVFLRLYAGFFFVNSLFCLSFFAITKRYLAILKELDIDNKNN